MAELSFSQEKTITHLDNAIGNAAMAIRQSLLLNGLGPKSPETVGILGELAKVRQMAIQEMMRDRDKKK
jgi:hypothetical protein